MNIGNIQWSRAVSREKWIGKINVRAYRQYYSQCCLYYYILIIDF